MMKNKRIQKKSKYPSIPNKLQKKRDENIIPLLYKTTNKLITSELILLHLSTHINRITNFFLQQSQLHYINHLLHIMKL